MSAQKPLHSVATLIRAVYVQSPWTTAEGLAKRFGVTRRAAIAAVIGGTAATGDVAGNLARARVEKAAEIQARLGNKARVKLEPDLARMTLEQLDPLDDAGKKECPTCRSRRARADRKKARIDAQRKNYQPLVGASVRAARSKRTAETMRPIFVNDGGDQYSIRSAAHHHAAAKQNPSAPSA
jgi:hypothetical protein